MPDLGLDSRLNFLDASARLLQDAAPSTSAHLMIERNNLAEEHEKNLSKAQSKDICKACGTLNDLDVTSKPEIRTFRRMKGKAANHDPEMLGSEHNIGIKCLVCHRVTKFLPSGQQQFKSRGSIQMRSNVTSPDAMSLTHSAMREPMEEASRRAAPTHAGSKRRAKARKQVGLQTLLDKSKEVQRGSSGLELGLLDFMKQK